MVDISEKIISMPVKTFVVLLIGIVTVAITIGGYKKVLDDVEKVEAKIDNMQKDIQELKISNVKIETILNQRP